MSRRTERIAGELQSEVAAVLRQDVRDPRVGLVTITRVDVAADLGNATVHWSAVEQTDGPDIDEIAEGLLQATAFVQRKVAGRMQLRRMPALHFRHDPSLDLAGRTLSVLRELESERRAREDRRRDDET